MDPASEKKDRVATLRIVGIYASFSALWIYFSDTVVGLFTRDPAAIVRISVAKGILFILLTSCLLYRLILRYIRQSSQAARATAESGMRLSKAQEIAHLGSWELDVVNNVLTWSDEVYRIFGLKPRQFEATYQAFLDAVHPEDRKSVDAAYSESLREGRDAYEIEHRVIRRATGEIRYVHEKCEHLRNEAGVVVRSVGMVHDVTDRKRTEQALKRANEELEFRVAERTKELEESRLKLEMQNAQLRETYRELDLKSAERIRTLGELREKEQMLIHQNRLVAMGEMLGNIAHQWRQPLNVLGLRIQDIRLTYKHGSLSKEFIDDNVAKSMEILRHMSQTIDDFREFTMPGKEKVLFRVDQLVTKTLSLIEASFREHRVAIDVDISGEPKITGYPNEFGQVLINVLMNAKDAFVEQKIEDARVLVRAWQEGIRAVVTITDNAGGIREEIKDKIFDAYFTTKEPGKGTGIGLFMSKTIVEKNMGGRITVRNTEDGAEFRIEI